jgi:nitroreductase|tara:strand:- start:1070 stop:1798 length:729 start_codon:yes stop_codon:yes gene_type:complete
MFNQMIEKSIHKSQHCQRNWDLSREIPAEDLETIKTAATQCPSKQNESFYKVIFVHDRDTINKIADCTKGFHTSSQYPYKANATGMDDELQINTQVQANLLVAFVRDFGTADHASTPELNMYHANNGKIEPELLETLERNRQMAIGIAAGYTNLTSAQLGYGTGCCECLHDRPEIERLLGLEDPTGEKVVLLMGIGYPDPKKTRREHHTDKGKVFPTFKRDIAFSEVQAEYKNPVVKELQVA